MFRAGRNTQHVEPLTYIIIIIWIFAPHHPFHSTNRHASSRPHEKTLHLVDLSRSRLTLMNSLRSFNTIETDQITFLESFSMIGSKRNESSKNNKDPTCGGSTMSQKKCFQNCIIILFWIWLFTWKKRWYNFHVAPGYRCSSRLFICSIISHLLGRCGESQREIQLK